jgi:hypothetical protein
MTRPMDRLETNPDRVNDLVIMTVLIIDTVLLALLELAFATFSVGKIPVPVSALVALLTTPLLVRAAGSVSQGQLGASGPLIAWIATVCVLGFTGPGGDVILTDAWPSLLLIIAGMVPAAFVLGRVLRGFVQGMSD